MKEPEYYNRNGLSPLTAFKKGLISKEEYRGFLKGNIIKYLVRYQYKNGVEDIEKLIHYTNELYALEKETGKI